MTEDTRTVRELRMSRIETIDQTARELNRIKTTIEDRLDQLRDERARHLRLLSGAGRDE